MMSVTLHVSVWVEICLIAVSVWKRFVTLHVSVWVEIDLDNQGYLCNQSRSTWACELKFVIIVILLFNRSSRSTWACELKCFLHAMIVMLYRHAPRERVSWNCTCRRRSVRRGGHAPRERVSWNATRWLCCGLHPTSRSTWACELKCTLETLYIISLNGHAPRERVSWNEKSNAHSKKKSVTLHVSVWVEMQNN